MDEPEPLGEGTGPNAARVLAAAIGNCLSASLLFCLDKARVEVSVVRTKVTGSIVRNEKRAPEPRAREGPDRGRSSAPSRLPASSAASTSSRSSARSPQSVRSGIEVDVQVDTADESWLAEPTLSRAV
jgi:hypothetical protein